MKKFFSSLMWVFLIGGLFVGVMEMGRMTRRYAKKDELSGRKVFLQVKNGPRFGSCVLSDVEFDGEGKVIAFPMTEVVIDFIGPNGDAITHVTYKPYEGPSCQEGTPVLVPKGILKNALGRNRQKF